MTGSPSSFVQHYEFLDGFLQPFQWFSDEQVRKKSAMSKRGQKATSNEGSLRWRKRDHVWCCESKGVRKSLHEVWDLVNPTNVDTWVRSSNVRRRCWDCPQLTQHSQWKHTKQLYWSGEMFMKAAIHLGPNDVPNSEICKNTKFKDIESVLNSTQKLVKEHSEEILNVRCLEYSSPSRARLVSAIDQAIKWAKAKVCVNADSVLYVLDRWKTLQEQEKDGRVKWKDSGCIRVTKMQWVSMEKQLNSTGRMPKKSRITQWDSQKDIGHSWVGRRSGMEVLTPLKNGNGIALPKNGAAIQRNWSSWIQKVSVPWVVESGSKRKVKPPFTSNGDSMNTELLFQTIHSVNHLGSTEEEKKGRRTKWWPSWNQKKYNSGYLLRHEQLETWCKKTFRASKRLPVRYSWHNYAKKPTSNIVLQLGKQYKTRPEGDDGWRTITPLCREYSSSRSSYSEGTIFGPVLEVHIVKVLDGYGIDVAIPSIENPTYTSYVVKSRETERFVNEIHDHIEELRSSNELFTELQGSVKSEPYEEKKARATKKLVRLKASRKFVRALSAFLLQKHPLYTNKRTIPTNERKWKVIHAHSPDGGYLATAVS